MKLISLFTTLSILLCLILFASCGRYIDQTKSSQNLPIKQGFFDFYADSNILVYTSNIGLARDIEIIYPKHFRITLPKGIKYYEIKGSTDFDIYYNNKQVFFLRLNLEDDINRDTMYIPKKDELNKFIQNGLIIEKFKFNKKKIEFITRRKNLFIRKGRATILLYNIKPSFYELFYNSANMFSFI